MNQENSERKSQAIVRAERLAKLEFLALLEQFNRGEREKREPRRRQRAKPDFYSHYLRLVEPVTRLKTRFSNSATFKPKDCGGGTKK